MLLYFQVTIRKHSVMLDIVTPVVTAGLGKCILVIQVLEFCSK